MLHYDNNPYSYICAGVVIFLYPRICTQVLNSLVSLSGNISFIDNRHNITGYSGALYISQSGRILLTRNTFVEFISNTGR